MQSSLLLLYYRQLQHKQTHPCKIAQQVFFLTESTSEETNQTKLMPEQLCHQYSVTKWKEQCKSHQTVVPCLRQHSGVDTSQNRRWGNCRTFCLQIAYLPSYECLIFCETLIPCSLLFFNMIVSYAPRYTVHGCRNP